MANSGRSSHAATRNGAGNRETTTSGGASGTQQSQQASPQGKAQPQTRGQRADEQREVPVGRESQQQSRTTIRDPQTSVGGPPSYNSPFTFMRRFAEDMDHLFEDFGLAPLSMAFEPLGVPGGRIGRAMTSSRALGAGGPRGLSSGATAVARPSTGSSVAARSDWLPQVEVLQRGDTIVVRADLPGMKREDVHVDVEDGILTLSGERHYESEGEEEGFYHSERSYGSFIRSIPLPQGVNADACKARFTDGVLEVTIPSPKDQSRSKRIEIR